MLANGPSSSRNSGTWKWIRHSSVLRPPSARGAPPAPPAGPGSGVSRPSARSTTWWQVDALGEAAERRPARPIAGIHPDAQARAHLHLADPDAAPARERGQTGGRGPRTRRPRGSASRHTSEMAAQRGLASPRPGRRGAPNAATAGAANRCASKKRTVCPAVSMQAARARARARARSSGRCAPRRRCRPGRVRGSSGPPFAPRRPRPGRAPEGAGHGADGPSIRTPLGEARRAGRPGDRCTSSRSSSSQSGR